MHGIALLKGCNRGTGTAFDHRRESAVWLSTHQNISTGTPDKWTIDGVPWMIQQVLDIAI
jgi:hypothetical protein